MKMDLKFNEKTIDKAQADIQAKLKEIVKSPALLSEVADVAIKDIQFQARRGVTADGNKFKALSSRWIKERQKIAQASATHETFKANRSNITITGQLLDAMGKMLSKSGIYILFKGMHQPYQAKRVRRDGVRTVGKRISNDKLSGYVNELRPFFKIRESLLPRLKNIVIRYIRRKL
jgi:hypothetical protein